MGRRPYSSALRAEQARATRIQVAWTAGEVFARDGYAATSVAAVARAAGVSTQTIYNAFATKPGLLKAAYDLLLAGDADEVPLAERPHVRALYELADARRFLHGYAALGRTLLDRVGPLAWQIAAGAAGGDPDLVAVHATTSAERLVGTGMVARRVADLGELAPTLTVEDARDRIWTLNSVEVWHLLTTGRGWGSDAYQEWVGDLMCESVLRRDG
jgi:AcrR family transcriptional regulator